MKNNSIVHQKATICFLFVLLSLFAHGQLNQWVWMGGSDTLQSIGYFGIKGIPDESNLPCARSASINWKNSLGKQYLYGGFGQATLGSSAKYQGDLWRWDGTYWTLIEETTVSSYGTKNMAASTNNPGSRIGSIVWQKDSIVYVFGGYAAYPSYLNDLWKWDGTAWTWIDGDSTSNSYGRYGIKNVPSVENSPGARYHSANWVDSLGNLWLFGGFGYAGQGSEGELNDLWKWDGTAWTWMGGSKDIKAPSRYGDKGVPNPLNNPGARFNSSYWKDKNDHVWIFGGTNYSNNDLPTYFNDLWRWDGVNWTYIKGMSSPYEGGEYGQLGIPDPKNIPGAREGSLIWNDTLGNIYLFGGFGVGKTKAYLSGFLNDLWRWDGSNWTWISGDNQNKKYAKYGIKKIASEDNIPGSRTNSIGWIDTDGNLWLFGGQGQSANSLKGESGLLNDIWKYNLTCNPKKISIENEFGSTTVETSNILTQNCSSLIAKIDTQWALNSVLGKINAGVWVDDEQSTEFVRRHYQITPENNPNDSKARITLYFTQQEFDDYNNVIGTTLNKLPEGPEDYQGISNLKVEKFDGVSIDGSGLPDSYSGASVFIDPQDSDIIWNSEDKYWEVTFEVNGFSGFFIKTLGKLNIQDQSLNEPKIYPNPARESINFCIDENLVSTYVEIYNNHGDIFDIFLLRTTNFKYFNPKLTTGLYFIRFNNGLVKKLIISQ